MKEQNNRDKLNDALGMVDEEMVQATMLHVEGMRAAHLSRRAMIRRRVAVLAAACLSFCLVVGAMLAVPLLLADDTEPPQDAGSLAPEEDHGGEMEEKEDFYVGASIVEASIVRLDMLSATETATISDPNIPTDNFNVNFQQSTCFTNLHVLIFDCQPGETVTLRANRECLGYIGMAYDPEVDPFEWGDFQKACDNLRHRSVLEKYEKGSRYKGSTGISESEESYTLYERELTIDPSSASVILCFDYSEPADDVEEDVILYTVTNAEGQITGAGGLYVGKKYVDGPNPRTPGRAVTISRAAVLGSVRFIDPASVTEAQVEALHSTYAEEGKNGQSMVDFTPVTHEEINAVAGREILDTLFKNQFVMGIGRGISYYADYSSFYVLTEDSDYEHEFIVFKDGTWAEIDCERGANASSNGHANAECPNTETHGHHGIGIGCIVKTTDGRFYQLDGKTATLIEDPTA